MAMAELSLPTTTGNSSAVTQQSDEIIGIEGNSGAVTQQSVEIIGIINAVIQQIHEIIELEEGLHVLHLDTIYFSRVEDLLGHLCYQFDREEQMLRFKNCLGKMKYALGVGKDLINRAKGLRGCERCVVLSNTEQREITEWQIRFDHIFQQLHILSVASEKAQSPLPTSITIGAFLREFRDVIRLEENFNVLKIRPFFGRNTEDFIRFVRENHPQTTLSKHVEKCLERMNDDLGEVKHLINRAKGLRGCFCYRLLRNSRHSKEINYWKMKYDSHYELFKRHSLAAIYSLEFDGVTNAIIGVLFQQLVDVRKMWENLEHINTELTRMDESLRHIQFQFEDQQKKLPEIVEGCLERIGEELEKVKDLKDSANRQRGRCRSCCLFFSPNIPADIREWKTRFNELFRQLDSDLSRAAHTAEIVGSAQPQAEVLLQPLPDSGIVGSGIEAAQQQLLSWLNEPNPQARVIGVWGMAGVGKTALLQLICNSCKKKVSTSFDLVIWHTISRKYEIDSLQDAIAESLKLKFEPSSSIDMRKMKLYDSLKDKRFLLVLDDLWSPINLNEVGVNFGQDKNSRVLISSRYRDVVEIMAEKEYCVMIRPLSMDEGWELFRRTAFRSGVAQDKNLEVIARQVAWECKGLPLAINTVAAALAGKNTAEEWRRALDLMKNADPSFPSTHKTIEAELYQKLRWSYDDLPNHDLKMCFLYCAAFPKDAEIAVETLVEMWTAERLVPQRGTMYFMDVGRQYIQALVDRCLIEYVDAEKREIKVHDVLRDMAIYVGQGEENCLFQAGQHLQHFPSEEETRDCKRISVLGNEISDLPPDFKCPTLVSLLLAGNRELKEIPEGFLVNCMSLKVLDLSYTSIKTLPTAVGQLGQLEFLNLEGCRELKGLPDSICSLSHLQFLNLKDCESLYFFPDKIGELKNLKHLTVSGVRVIPHQISQLTSLNKLVLPPESTPMCLEDFTNLSNLIELDVTVKPEIKGRSMSTWSKMRKLRLRFEWGEDEKGDDAALDILPQNMQSMEELQSLELEDYQGVSLPTCICQFQNLKNLYLRRCMNLEELPRGGFPQLQRLNLLCLDSLKTLRIEELPNLRKLHIFSCAELKELFMESGGCFPQLEKLSLSSLHSLESIVCNAKTMPQLHSLRISDCGGLKTLRMEEFPDLQHIGIYKCPELEVEIESLPMLKELHLEGLEKAESIARPWSVWNSDTMPNLEVVRITGCPLLRRMPREMEKLPKLKKIVGNFDWWDGISWENDSVKSELSQLFKEFEESDEDFWRRWR